MKKILSIIKFSLPFVRPYWPRMLAGVLCGVLFGLSNGGVVWLTKTMLTRLSPPASAESSSAPALTESTPRTEDRARMPSGWSGWIQSIRSEWRAWSERVIEPWLPEHGERMDGRQLIAVLVFLPLLGMARSAAAYLAAYCMAWTGQRVINDLRVKVVEVLSSLSLDYFNRSTLGDLITRINEDTAALRRCLSVGVEHLVTDPITLISVLTMLFFLDWKLTLSTFILAPAIVVPVIVLGRKSRAMSKKVVRTNVAQSNHILEMLSHIRVIKAFTLENDQVNRFRDHSKKLFRQTMSRIRAMESSTPLIESIAIIGFAVLLAYVVQSQRPVSDMMSFFLGLMLLYTPVKKLARLHMIFKQTSVGVDRLTSVISEKPSVSDPVHPKPLKAFQSEIRFEKVGFTYGIGPVLRNIQLRIPRGFKLGIAGESGSGKSTLINLLFRFFDPTEGRITIDGLDLRDVALEPLRRQMALVSQDVVVFNTSVAENIACGKKGSTREEVEAAARAAHAHEFIMALPDGYDSYVGERGVTLSGGQRQRLAIARAFIRDAPILVLDEATAALDSKSEAEVQKAIDGLAANRTVLCIAHRLGTLANMDWIIVLAKGEIVEQGTLRELLKARGIFAQMAAKQGMVHGDVLGV